MSLMNRTTGPQQCDSVKLYVNFFEVKLICKLQRLTVQSKPSDPNTNFMKRKKSSKALKEML